jgi:putative DNA primase/helicase
MLGGDYAQQINPEELMAQRQARHSTELAQLRGARMVVAMETTEGRRLNESLIKALTGGDKIRARFMREDSFEFKPELKLFMGTNCRPNIRDSSVGMWRRVRLIPLNVEFSGERRDPRLQEKLIKESEGILAWAVKGAQRAANGEPNLPKRVEDATKEYKEDQDNLTAFIEEECELRELATTRKADLYRAYQQWSKFRCEGKSEFGKRFALRGFEETRLHGGIRAWSGIALRPKNLPACGDVR